MKFLEQTVTIVKATKSKLEATAAPGKVINIDKNGVTVSADGGNLTIEVIKDHENNKMGAFEWAKMLNLKLKDQFS